MSLGPAEVERVPFRSIFSFPVGGSVGSALPYTINNAKQRMKMILLFFMIALFWDLLLQKYSDKPSAKQPSKLFSNNQLLNY